MKEIQTPVCIVGAGPGGAAAALKLNTLGIPCTIVDKATFPRDKICGDAISGKVTTLLHRLDPTMLSRFHALRTHTGVWGIRFVAPNLKQLDIPFQDSLLTLGGAAPGYVCKRVDFDNFLVDELKQKTGISLLEQTDIRHIEKTSSGFRLMDTDQTLVIHCRLLIMAAGAHASFSRKYAGLNKDNAHHAAAVRAYYKDVSGISEGNFIELHFLKSILPGYFWIFPLPDGRVNVGLGMRSDIISKNSINLKETFARLIQEEPSLRERFSGATQESPLQGFGLPLGSKKRKISGEGFMLVGDAGHLIDPLTGEGIGNAFYSGIIAAEQAAVCLEKNDISASIMKAYDIRVARVLGSEMQLSYRLQRMLAYPWLASLLANIIAGNAGVIKAFTGMYTDFEQRLSLVKPSFWIKMWLSRQRG
jgi:geranylgeranyl reductase family protein